MTTNTWVVQSRNVNGAVSKITNEALWTKDEVILPEDVNLEQARVWLNGFVNNNTDPDTQYRLIVRTEFAVSFVK
jgi:L-asparaginase/Glu-tRNA(Gln) amidotransferase subunit D